MIVMGLDQQRAQITAEWIDTETGEVSRMRVSPAHRTGVWTSPALADTSVVAVFCMYII